MSEGRGRFIVLEGIEGAGKSTQAALLSRWLEGLGVPHLSTREPGGTDVGEEIRGIVLDHPDRELPHETELFLILAARAAFVRQVVRPALDEGRVVVADRYDLSTLAYQGFGRELELDAVRTANGLATGGLRPDLCVLLDVEVERGVERQARDGQEKDRIEGSGLAFLRRVRHGYHALARSEPGVVIVDGTGSSEEVHRRIRTLLRERFPETFQDA